VSSQRPHEPEHLTLTVSRAPTGGLIIRTPMCPGWAVPARSPQELAQRIEQAYCEAAVAAYARLRGVLYDLAETEERIPPEAYAAVRTRRRSPTRWSSSGAVGTPGTRPRTSRSGGRSCRTGRGCRRRAAGTGRTPSRCGRWWRRGGLANGRARLPR
jgi:hypothetical protein